MPPLDEIRAAFLRRPHQLVVNSSGELVPPFAVMRIVSSVQTNGIIVTTIAKPNSTFLSEYLVNGPWSIGSGSADWGLATALSEANYVLYDDASTPAVGQEWGPQPSSWELKKWRYGFRIKGHTQTFTDYNAVVARQFEVLNFYGKADGLIAAAGSSGTLDIYDGNGADTTLEVAVTNRTGMDVEDTKWAKATIMGGTVFVDPWECPA